MTGLASTRLGEKRENLLRRPFFWIIALAVAPAIAAPPGWTADQTQQLQTTVDSYRIE